ncbi:SDR family oxidoreductase [Tautonia plasticadhaerens]|uniref:3-oxoacyl-[acyl-carrier-protein] reductase FabG n=1 Tax=Tautonia plasticadhaerens TaxID=2527974 RepID=A0A518HDJ2_9BACT|nr:SDR family oxidoreductase [Tautonia plasticadhaerens]QDV38931.1 3-oxoacyl-[acyl-carrier-protein] reductase FabG [Tautonia plasticadhaerens]
MAFLVDGQTALVTGANRGIGKSIVEALIKHGANAVYAAVRDPESARPLVEAYGDRVRPVELDLTRPETISAAAGLARDVRLVVNNAGVLKAATARDDHAFESLAFELDANVFGLLRVAQAFLPVLKANGGGAFVQLNSVVSLKCFPQFSTYCASKAASYSLTQALRSLAAGDGVEILSVHPGPIATDMGHDAGLSEIAEPPGLVAEAIVAALAAGEFHVFPDSMARRIGGAYDSFAKGVIEAEMGEG